MLFLLSCADPITNAFLLEDLEYLSALPQRDQHQILITGRDTATSDVEAWSASFNTTLESLLGWVDGVRELPPTERGVASRVWGPHAVDTDGAVTWRVTIERIEPGRFSWSFEVREGTDGEWQAFFTGSYLAGFDPSESQGDFEYTTAPLLTLGYGDDDIAITVEYDYIGEHELYAQVQKDGAVADYHFQEEDGESRAWFAQEVDVYDDPEIEEDLQEDYRIAGQWLSTGAGRMESYATGGDFGTLEVFYSQCWDDAGTVVYTEYTCVGCTEPAAGDEADCVFSEGLDPRDPPD